VGNSEVDIFSKTMNVKWEKVTSLPACISGHTAVLLHGLIYVGGGSEEKEGKKVESYSLHVYNLSTNKWNALVTTPCCDFAMTTLNDKLFIAGGATKNDEVMKKVFVLNTANGEWKDYSEMPTAKYCATAVGYQSLLIIIGGVTITKGVIKILAGGRWSAQSTTELLDTTNGQWYTCDNIPSPHAQLKAVVVNDTLYMLGGANSNLKPSLQVLGASLDDTVKTHKIKWQSLADIPFCYSTPAVLCNKYLLTVGGRQQQSDDSSHISEVRALNPVTALWKQIANLPIATSFPAAVSMDNKLVVIGGMTKDKKFSNTVWIGVFE